MLQRYQPPEPPPLDIRPATPRLDISIHCLLILMLIAVPVVRGGVNALGEFLAIGIGGVIAVLLAVRQAINPQRVGGGWIVWTPIVFFIALALAQLVPLPASA